jgi:Eukaryotic aspartyl protease
MLMIGGIDMSLIIPPILSLPMESAGGGDVEYTVAVSTIIFRRERLSWWGRRIGTREKAKDFGGRVVLDTGATEIYLPDQFVTHFVEFFGCGFKGPSIACPCSLQDDMDAALIFNVGGYNVSIDFPTLMDRGERRSGRNSCFVRVRASATPSWGIPFFRRYLVIHDLVQDSFPLSCIR